MNKKEEFINFTETIESSSNIGAKAIVLHIEDTKYR